MSLRDFNSPSDDPIALHNSPQGNGGGLGNFHTINPEDREPNNTPKIVGALAVALMVGVAGVGLYAYSGSSSNKPIVAANNVQATMPAPVAQPAPEPAAMAPAADTSAPAPAADASPAPPPMRSASSKPSRSMTTARSETSMTNPAPQQQAAAVPEPVAPTPSPNDVATANTQPITATPQPQAPVADVPATTAQDQQSGATPAPAAPASPPAAAQSAGQVAQ